MYSDTNEITLELTEREVARLFYAIEREKVSMIESRAHEKSGRKQIAAIEEMMDSIREQALEQEMRDPKDNL